MDHVGHECRASNIIQPGFESWALCSFGCISQHDCMQIWLEMYSQALGLAPLPCEQLLVITGSCAHFDVFGETDALAILGIIIQCQAFKTCVQGFRRLNLQLLTESAVSLGELYQNVVRRLKPACRASVIDIIFDNHLGHGSRFSRQTISATFRNGVVLDRAIEGLLAWQVLRIRGEFNSTTYGPASEKT